MELAFSTVAAADANFLDGVQANNVTKELTRTGIAGERRPRAMSCSDFTPALREASPHSKREKILQLHDSVDCLRVRGDAMGEELRSGGYFSKKPPSFGRGFANFLTARAHSTKESP